MTGVFMNVSSLLLRRDGCLSALPANSMDFPCPLQGNGYGNTGGISKLEGVRELGFVSSPAEDAALVAEAERNPFCNAKILKLLLAFLGKDTR